MKPPTCGVLGLAGLLAWTPLSRASDDLLAVNSPGDVYTIDSATGQGHGLDAARQFGDLHCLAKNLLGVMYAASNESLITVDEFTGRTALVTTLEIDYVRGLAFGPDGTLYAIDDGGIAMPDLLYSIDVGSGATTLIGATSHARIQGFAIDRAGRAVAWDTQAGLLRVDLHTGATTDVNGLSDGTQDINALTFSPGGELFGCRYSLFTIDVGSGAWSAIGHGGYVDIQGLAFIGAANGRRLEVLGSCPGQVTVQWTGCAANRPAVLVVAAARGAFTVPAGPCRGAVLGVTGRVRAADPPGVFNTGSGSGSLSGTVGTGACGLHVQLIEAGSCAVSNAAPIP